MKGCAPALATGCVQGSDPAGARAPRQARGRMPEGGHDRKRESMLDNAQRAWVDQCAKLAADELRWDGDTVELPNGETLTLHVEPDQDSSVFDEAGEGMWVGMLEWTHRTNDYGWPIRPDWADGGAEILQRDHNSALWWRPLEDCLRDRELRNKLRATLCELLEYGYSIVGVEYRGETAWIGGCNDVYPELVSEQAAEVMREVLEREHKARAERLSKLSAMVGLMH